MAYSQNFPAQRPSFMFDASNAGRIPPNMTYSRASTGSYFGTEKVLSSENILLQSQTLDTTWAAVDVAAPTGSQTAPDGTSTAWLLTADSASSQTPYVRQSPTFSGSTQYTMVGHLKAGTASHGYISFRTQNGYSAYALLDFSGGTVSHAGFGDFTGVTSSVTALGSSWFKVTLTATTGSNLSGSNVLVGISDGTTPVGAGYATWNSAGETMYAWGIQLSSTNAKVYDSPTTTQIAREYQTKLQTAASGAARFEHSATDGQSVAKGILLESQSTNLATYGSDLTNAAWNPLSAFIGGTAVGPDGTLSAVKLVASAGSGLAPRFRRLSLLTDTTQTFSIYVKPLEFQHLAISADGSTACMVLYNLSGSGAITSATGATGAVEQCGNGWFRVSFSYTTTPSLHLAITMQSSTTYQTETGNGYDGMLFALAQLENQSFSSSFIGTTSSTATRAADSLSVTDASLFNTGTGGLVVEAVVKSLNDGVAAWLGTDGNNYHQVGQFGSTTYPLISKADGVASAVLSSAAVSTGAAHKVAASWDTNDFAGCVDGGTVVTDTSGTLPAVNKLTVGNYNAAAAWLDGHVKRVALYNEALSDTNLQALTS